MRNIGLPKRKIEKKKTAEPVIEEKEEEKLEFTVDLGRLNKRAFKDDDDRGKPFYYDIANGIRKKGR